MAVQLCVEWIPIFYKKLMLATKTSDFLVICLRNNYSDEVLIYVFLFHQLVSYLWNFFFQRRPKANTWPLTRRQSLSPVVDHPVILFWPKFDPKPGNQSGSLSSAEHLVKIISVKDWNDGLTDYICLSTKLQPTFRDSIKNFSKNSLLCEDIKVLPL